ncbi:MAG: restriction endonuclease [Firmicutes bacterium]|nr:restriction endonuclease [Bacillota bacterium]
MSDLIQVENSTEYYKNGNIKAYQSILHHIKLDKVVKVRHKEHSIYKRKFDDACKLLMLEWESVSTTKNVEIFIEKSQNFHVYSYNSSKFKFNTFVDKQIKENVNQTIKTPSYKVLNEISKPSKTDEKYILKENLLHKIFPFYANRKKKELEIIYNKNLAHYNKVAAENERIRIENKQNKENYMKQIQEIENKIKSIKNRNKTLYENYANAKESISIIEYFEHVMSRDFDFNNIYKKISYEIDFDIEDRTLVVNFQFPLESNFPQNKEFKLIKTKQLIKETPFKQKEYTKLIMDSYYSLYIAIINEFIKVDVENIVDNIVLNGFYKGMDTRLGKEFETCIMTSKVDVDEFKKINLININPRDTFKYFSGKGIPNPENITKVEPIRFLDKGKFKLIDSNQVLSSLSAETNLAAIDWQDFETLVREVFELEFKEQDIEIRNTQHSNDGGIDIVAFNNNPYTGGVILVQAKRYTNTVTPEPVRALKGSMEEHKAIRGILVTTSDFGSASREFAAQHNITLINGEQLVDMFKSHNYDFHIDLEQAKSLNSNNFI